MPQLSEATTCVHMCTQTCSRLLHLTHTQDNTHHKRESAHTHTHTDFQKPSLIFFLHLCLLAPVTPPVLIHHRTPTHNNSICPGSMFPEYVLVLLLCTLHPTPGPHHFTSEASDFPCTPRGSGDHSCPVSLPSLANFCDRSHMERPFSA